MKTNQTLLTLTLIAGAGQADASLLYNNNIERTEPSPSVMLRQGYEASKYRRMGNQVNLGSPVVVTNFSCNYWSTDTVNAQLTFYANDGPRYSYLGSPTDVLKPSSVLYRSAWQPLAPTADYDGTLRATPDEWGRFSQNLDDMNLVLPEEFTWTLEFADFTTVVSAVGLFQSRGALPTTGELAFPYMCWVQFSTGTWFPSTAPGSGWSPDSAEYFSGFEASMEGEMVPEPSPLLYAAVLCGGIGFWKVRRRWHPDKANKRQ